MKIKINWKTAARMVYIGLIIILVVFGMIKDSEVATALIQAVKDAFSILF